MSTSSDEEQHRIKVFELMAELRSWKRKLKPHPKASQQRSR